MAAGASAASEWSERGEISKFRHNKSEFILKNYLDPLEGTFRLAHLGFTAHLAGDGKPAQGPFHSQPGQFLPLLAVPWTQFPEKLTSPERGPLFLQTGRGTGRREGVPWPRE